MSASDRPKIPAQKVLSASKSAAPNTTTCRTMSIIRHVATKVGSRLADCSLDESQGQIMERSIGGGECEDRVMVDDFDRLLEEALRAPADTWDFGWLEGRATEERPSWRYFDRVCERTRNARRLLDIDGGTGNMLADLPDLPPLAVATDSYRPSIQTAGPRLRARGAHVVQTQRDLEALPFADASVDLVISRHPVETWWTEIARVLEPGGHYYSQHVGPHSLRDLSGFLMGPLPVASKRDPEVARRAAEAAGLVVDDLRVERTKVVFHDIGAVVYLLRLVVWTVPDFTVSRYRPQLRQLHDHIKTDGVFETTSSRFLIDAHQPA